jgi:hypothetical protein
MRILMLGPWAIGDGLRRMFAASLGDLTLGGLRQRPGPVRAFPFGGVAFPTGCCRSHTSGRSAQRRASAAGKDYLLLIQF